MTSKRNPYSHRLIIPADRECSPCVDDCPACEWEYTQKYGARPIVVKLASHIEAAARECVDLVLRCDCDQPNRCPKCIKAITAIIKTCIANCIDEAEDDQ